MCLIKNKNMTFNSSAVMAADFSRMLASEESHSCLTDLICFSAGEGRPAEAFPPP
jgi:hypothetical protein